MGPKAFKYDEASFNVTDEMKQNFDNDGYVLVKGILSNEEVQHIEKALHEGSFSKYTHGVSDGEGKEAQVILWRYPGVDVTGMVGRCEKIAGTSEKLLGGEVYHYYTKLMKKNAGTGGKITWHQDYGYWYDNGNLFPDMLVCFIAMDKCTKENGCLQLLKGSQKCGRLDHKFIEKRGQRVISDLNRVDDIAKICPHEYVEMDPGDAIFFHCNLLHCSSDNTSPLRRWAFLSVYNKASNDPVKKHHYPNYNRLDKVDNSAILECNDFTTMDGKMFLDVEKETGAGRNIVGSKS